MVDKHLNILRQGRDVWNEWVKTAYKDVQPITLRADKVLRLTKVVHIPFMNVDLSKTDLTEFSELKGFDFRKIDFTNCNLRGIDFTGSQFRKANFTSADLRDTKFDNCNCELTNFIHSNLNNSSFKKANLQGTNLSDTSLYKTNFKNAKLAGSRLMWAKIIETNFSNADLSNCRVYGASIWNIELEKAIQSNIIITKRDEFDISVDNLEIAQFLYLIISNSKIKSVIETLTSKIVLILGRFTPERKLVLNRLKEELATLNYVPVIFDFQKPSSKDFIEPILTIAQLARFIIADFSDPKIVLEEIPIIARNTSTVIIPILQSEQREPVTLNNLRVNQRSISKTFFYDSVDTLIDKQLKDILNTGNKLLTQLNRRKQK